MLQEFTQWLLGVIKQFFSDLWQFVLDVLLTLVESILDALAYLISSVGVPDFLSTGLSSLFSMLDPGIAWIISQVGLGAALTVVGAGYLFRITRKALTLFQW